MCGAVSNSDTMPFTADAEDSGTTRETPHTGPTSVPLHDGI